MEKVRCQFKTKDGTQCKNRAVKRLTPASTTMVCKLHYDYYRSTPYWDKPGYTWKDHKGHKYTKM